MRKPFILLILGIALFSAYGKAYAIPKKEDVKPPFSCRSQSVKHQFDIDTNNGKSMPGTVVDHWCALECGGIDATSNMVRQSKKQGAAKDRWERTPEGCALTCNAQNSTPVRLVFNCK